MRERITEFICRHFHGEPYAPVCGVYRCRKCLRTYPVPWNEKPLPVVSRVRTVLLGVER